MAAAPLRERRQGQLMRALNSSGRQAEALETYRGFRQRLVDDMGLEPGAGPARDRAGDPSARGLRDRRIAPEAVCRREPVGPAPSRSAAGPVAGGRSCGVSRRSRGGDGKRPVVAGEPSEPDGQTDLGTVARLNPDSGAVLGQVDVMARVGVGDGFGDIVVADDDVWVLNEIDHTVSRVDIDDASVSATVTVGADPVSLAVARGDVWVTSAAEDMVVRVDGASGRGGHHHPGRRTSHGNHRSGRRHLGGQPSGPTLRVGMADRRGHQRGGRQDPGRGPGIPPGTPMDLLGGRLGLGWRPQPQRRGPDRHSPEQGGGDDPGRGRRSVRTAHGWRRRGVGRGWFLR